MRNISAPAIAMADIFDDCVSTIGSASKRSDFVLAKPCFVTAELEYKNAAKNRLLFQLPVSNDKSDAILFGSLSKGDIKNLYSAQMVPAAKPARRHYDRLLVNTPHRRCPYCGFGRATTLDHFLNKSEYPWLAITPFNLVPACKDCNHWKRDDRASTADEQAIHPYFEDLEVSDNQWLYASVIVTVPMSIEYRLQLPVSWSAALKLRVEKHFDNFDLKARFAVEAASELATLRNTIDSLRQIAGDVAVRQHLDVIAFGEFEQHRNSWRTALYQALAESAWYRQSGYLLG